MITLVRRLHHVTQSTYFICADWITCLEKIIQQYIRNIHVPLIKRRPLVYTNTFNNTKVMGAHMHHHIQTLSSKGSTRQHLLQQKTKPKFQVLQSIKIRLIILMFFESYWKFFFIFYLLVACAITGHICWCAKSTTMWVPVSRRSNHRFTFITKAIRYLVSTLKSKEVT